MSATEYVGAHGIPSHEDMAARLAAARGRIAGVAHVTPVLTSRQLDDACGASVFLKCENLQRMGAFKFRGAWNTIRALPDETRRHGLRVVPRRVRHHAVAACLVRQRADRVPGAAELERAHALQVLALQEHARAAGVVELA